MIMWITKIMTIMITMKNDNKSSTIRSWGQSDRKALPVASVFYTWPAVPSRPDWESEKCNLRLEGICLISSAFPGHQCHVEALSWGILSGYNSWFPHDAVVWRDNTSLKKERKLYTYHNNTRFFYRAKWFLLKRERFFSVFIFYFRNFSVFRCVFTYFLIS